MRQTVAALLACKMAALAPVEVRLRPALREDVDALYALEAASYLADVRCRVALLRCEHGLVTADIGDYMYEQLGRVAPVIELPTAGHHPMLDVPLILVTALRALLADWDHSRPLGRAPGRS